MGERGRRPLARRVATGGRFLASLARARVAGSSAEAKAVFSTLRALGTASTLPSPLDTRIALPPVRKAWCRRVAGHNLWIVYDLHDDVVSALLVLREPPVPID